MSVLQSLRQQSVRDVTGTAYTYEGDWHALFDADGIATGPFNGRLLAWINAQLSASYTDLPGAMQAFAEDQGYANWSSMGTFALNAAALSLDFTTGSLDNRITFSRTSNATMYDSTGKLTYAPNNLLVRSQEFDNASWTNASGTVNVSANATTAPDGTLTADKLVPAAATAWMVKRQTITVTTGRRYIRSVYAKAGDTGVHLELWVRATVGAIFNLATGAVLVSSNVTTSVSAEDAYGFRRYSIIYTGDSTDQQDVRLTTSTTTLDTQMVGDGSKGFYAWGAQLEAVTYQTTPSTYVATTASAYYGPRFDYDPSTLAAKGLLIEEARTNVVLWNRDLTNAAWTKSNVTAAKDQTGIDGVASSASKITATAANGTCLQAITLASSQRFQSTYVKRVTGSSAVEMTTDNGTTWTPITVTADWTRVSIPAQTLANPTVGFRIVTSGDAIAVDCVQNETGAFATSAIPTGSASVTRASDTVSMTGTNFSDWYTAATGTFLVEFDGPANGDRTILAVDDDTANEMMRLRTEGTDPYFRVIDGGVEQAAIDAGTVAASTFYKFAAAYEANNFAASIGGGAAVADTGGTLPTVDRLRIGTGQAGNTLCGHVKSITYYATRKSNADLATLTAA